MTTITLPVSIYSIRQPKPTTRYGSPAAVPFKVNTYRALVRASLTRIPKDATITSAVIKFYMTSAGNRVLQARPLTGAFSASTTWSNQPAVNGLMYQAASGTSRWVQINVTPWAITRNANGLRIDTTTAAVFNVAGSVNGSVSARPILVVTYTQLPDTPGKLTPSGGAVSVPKPVLTYAGDPDMTQQRIDFSIDGGATVAYTEGWVPATEGYYEQPAGSPTPAVSGGIWWRATVQGPEGVSVTSPWASYTYEPLPSLVVTSPGALSADGSPTFVWDAPDQKQWQAQLIQEPQATIIDKTPGWVNEADTRAWTPLKGVPVPGGIGRALVMVRDEIVRVSAAGAPDYAQAFVDFTTTLAGAGAGMTTLTMEYVDPVPTFSGTRAGGIPDEVSLLRDGVQVPIWNADGEAGLRLPGSDFFTDATHFTIRDYTAPPRKEHTWKVLAWTNGVPSSVNPTVTERVITTGAYLVQPGTGQQVEIRGLGEVPAVEQTTEENAVLHMPINGGLIVEPVRRRLTRSTKAGTINGLVLDEDEDTLLAWVEGSSAEKYRLVFGKVNWSVIIGDYSPSDVLYNVGEYGTPDRVLVSLNWWQRLADL